MKTHILELEPGDDITSALDKMEWSNSGRILLVWPHGKKLLNRKLDLVLLQRKSLNIGAQLALVSKDSEIRYHAFHLGIPVFSSLKKAQNDHWRVPRRYRKQTDKENLHGIDRRGNGVKLLQIAAMKRVKPTTSTSARVLFFTAGIISVLAIAATLVPTAQITIKPKIQQQEIQLDVFTSDLIEGTSLLGAVPSEMITIDVEGRDMIDVTGTLYLPYQSAVGQVIFRNLTDQAIDLPEGTIVRPLGDSERRYATMQSRVVPAGTDQNISVEVKCLLPGTQGNLPAKSINAIEGNLGTLLSVSNDVAIVGGTDRMEPVPSDADRVALSERLDSTLLETAKQEILAIISSKDLLLTNTLKSVETLEEQYLPDGKLPADTLSLTWRKQYEARIVRYDQMQILLTSILDANMPEGYEPQHKEIEIEFLESPHETEDMRIAWKIKVTRTLQAAINSTQATQTAIGLTPDEAADRLNTIYPLAAAPEIILRPTWWPVMPILPFNIDIQTITAEGIPPSETAGS